MCDGVLIPGLPDDLVLLCFAWLPRRLHALASCVSRAWKHAFQSQALLSLRCKLGTLDTRLFLCLQGYTQDIDDIYCYDYSWCVIDPALFDWHPISSPPLLPVRVRGYDAMAAAIGHGEVLLVANPYSDPDTAMKEICRLDLFRKCWLSPSPPNMLIRRKFFASASLDGYVYVAGGGLWEYIVLGRDNSNDRVPLKSAERLDCKTMSLWERLPDMHVARIRAGAVVLNGCFYVIGGYNEAGIIYSGEIWDPSSQKWILIPELWPYHIFRKSSVGAKYSVAAVMGHLFAIKEDWKDRRELILYNHATKIWTSLGCIPIDSFCHDSKCANDFVCKAFGVGKELWVVVDGVPGHDMFMIACTPLSGQSISWRRLPYSFYHYLVYLGIVVSV